MDKKLKVVWICHFSNEEILGRLSHSNIKFRNRIKSLLGMKIENSFSDFSPWVTNLIKEFEKFEDTELHIISPAYHIKYYICEFENNGVFYHFFKHGDLWIRLLTKIWWWNKKHYPFNRHFVKRFLSKIKPDIVNLIGTENPYYSITTLDIVNIPVYISAQTVYTNPDRKKYSDFCLQENWDLELNIHAKELYYGCSGRMHRDLILNNNPNAIIFKMFFPIEKPKQLKELPKIFDFVFFAGLSKQKGIEDLIDALAIVKREKCNVQLNIIGKCSEFYMSLVLNKINELGLTDNIVFNSFFSVHSDMHQHIVQSHFAVLPIKLDIIPSSVIEAILLDLPVVTYKTSGTPYLNKDGEAVLLGDIGDIDSLACNMLKLLNSPILSEILRINAKAFVEREFDNTISAKRLVNNYRAVLDHYHKNIPIPEEQLFSTDEFPIY